MGSPFHSFCGLIAKLDPHEDTIILEQKLKYLASDINDVVEGDENNLESALTCFNERAIEDNDFAVNFAMLFTSHYFDGLREHLQSPDGNSAFREHILNMLQRNHSNADKLKAQNITHFYNSITLLGEFYHRLNKKSQPVGVVGRSLFDLLAKEVRNVTINCTNDPAYTFEVEFARLLLTQVTINGSLAKVYHQNEIELLFYEVRKCLIQVSNLLPVTKTFLLMSLDLYYNDFKSLGHNLENFYGKYLDEHDTNERMQRSQIAADTVSKSKDTSNPEPSNNGSFSLRNLAKDFANLKASARTNGGSEENRKINREYLNRPLKASDRLKYFQNSNSSLSVKSSEDNSRSQSRLANEPGSDGSSQHIATNNIDSKQREQSSNDLRQVAAVVCVAVTPPSDDVPLSPTTLDAPDTGSSNLETFDWFEAVQREEEYDESNSIDELNHSAGSSNSNNRFERLSTISQDGVSSHSPQPGRSRRNSLNRFRSDSYRQSTEDLYVNEKRSARTDGTTQYATQSWRNSGRQSPRRDHRNGYNKRTEYDRERDRDCDRDRERERDRERDVALPSNGRHNDGNFNRRNLVRGGSVDSKTVTSRNRHDSFNRRQQDSENFEHFQSYNRKTYPRNKDNFMSNRSLPPRLQQKLQQQRQDYNNDCDNSKRYNNRSSTNSAVVGRSE